MTKDNLDSRASIESLMAQLAAKDNGEFTIRGRARLLRILETFQVDLAVPKAAIMLTCLGLADAILWK